MDAGAGLKNCTEESCPLEEMVWRYARRNLAMLNIFIKVTSSVFLFIFTFTH